MLIFILLISKFLANYISFLIIRHFLFVLLMFFRREDGYLTTILVTKLFLNIHHEFSTQVKQIYHQIMITFSFF